jgi:hypothetical protein
MNQDFCATAFYEEEKSGNSVIRPIVSSPTGSTESNSAALKKLTGPRVFDIIHQ